MSLGQKILDFRVKAGKTQKDISEVTGLAVSYLSRLENNRVVPSVKTLGKIAGALRLPLSAFFDGEEMDPQDQCPVSISGNCILERVHPPRGTRGRVRVESYTPEQLEMLRLCNFLLHSEDPNVMTTLKTVLQSMANSVQSSRRRAS